eukprot:1142646-Pelagomonas_calceolata.AAC.8
MAGYKNNLKIQGRICKFHCLTRHPLYTCVPPHLILQLLWAVTAHGHLHVQPVARSCLDAHQHQLILHPIHRVCRPKPASWPDDARAVSENGKSKAAHLNRGLADIPNLLHGSINRI